MNKILPNPNELEEYIDTALLIQDKYGVNKALCYLIRGKFYDLGCILYSARNMIRTIDEERKKEDHNPVQERKCRREIYIENLDGTYENDKEIVTELLELLPKFATWIKGIFGTDEIQKYFDSNPRLGPFGYHTGLDLDEELESFFGNEEDCTENTLDDEIEEALICGDMVKYFGINV